MTDTPEDESEKRYRLSSEAECRKVAALIKERLHEGMGFVLVTADIGEAPGGGSKRYSNTSYVASVQRDDAARLLSELLDYWRDNGDHVTEPSPQTGARIREQVFRLKDIPLQRLLANARCSVRDASAALQLGDGQALAMQALKMAVEALAVFDRVVTDSQAKPSAPQPSPDQN
jgi:hypothetical protein